MHYPKSAEKHSATHNIRKEKTRIKNAIPPKIITIWYLIFCQIQKCKGSYCCINYLYLVTKRLIQAWIAQLVLHWLGTMEVVGSDLGKGEF